jgi:hypothetical protein
MPTTFPPAALALLQASFLAIVLRRVLSHGRVYFRHLKCRHRKEDALQEMIALTWLWHLCLAEKGRDATCFSTALATYAARAVRCGRRLVGQERAKDVLSPRAQQEQHFALEKLPDFSTLGGSPLEEALHDNTKSSPDAAACFKLHFTAWLASLSERDHHMVEDLMLGERTLDVADKYGVCPGRIAQKRREFFHDWRAFCGEGLAPSPPNHRGIA